jgi:hypothetical protein
MRVGLQVQLAHQTGHFVQVNEQLVDTVVVAPDSHGNHCRLDGGHMSDQGGRRDSSSVGLRCVSRHGLLPNWDDVVVTEVGHCLLQGVNLVARAGRLVDAVVLEEIDGLGE